MEQSTVDPRFISRGGHPIDRHITQGTRSEKGRRWCERIWTVIASAPAGGTVDFLSGLTGTITLTSGELAINQSVTLSGPGASVLAVSGNKLSRVFDLTNATAVVAISGLTIENASAAGMGANGWGGGIENRGTLSLTNSVLADNFAAYGGGIDNWGPLTISGCTLSGNSTTPSFGGGDGGVYSSNGNVTVANSTFTGNVGEQGGGIVNNGGSLSVDGSTFSQNHGGVGGGIFSVFTTATASITNSTFSGKFADTTAGYA